MKKYIESSYAVKNKIPLVALLVLNGSLSLADEPLTVKPDRSAVNHRNANLHGLEKNSAEADQDQIDISNQIELFNK